jgi:hypothetical protein
MPRPAESTAAAPADDFGSIKPFLKRKYLIQHRSSSAVRGRFSTPHFINTQIFCYRGHHLKAPSRWMLTVPVSFFQRTAKLFSRIADKKNVGRCDWVQSTSVPIVAADIRLSHGVQPYDDAT